MFEHITEEQIHEQIMYELERQSTVKLKHKVRKLFNKQGENKWV
jgi:hypothetical protein